MDNGITDDNGYFETKDLPIGFYDFIANHPGYVDKIMQYQLFDNRDPLHEMRLSTL